MKYLYDSERDALTIQLADRKYVESEEVWPGVVVDFDADGRPIALDFTEDASRHVDVKGLESGVWRNVSSRVAGEQESRPVRAKISAKVRRARRSPNGAE
jgi:uncharacterized protein YuzE